MIRCTDYAARTAETPIASFRVERRDPGSPDVDIEIPYSGVCQSELHQVRDERQNTVHPCMPGHEIVGRVSRLGGEVTDLMAGDLAAVVQPLRGHQRSTDNYDYRSILRLVVHQ